MNLQFTDNKGKQYKITDLEQFAQLIETGIITSYTLIYDEEQNREFHASELPEYQYIMDKKGKRDKKKARPNRPLDDNSTTHMNIKNSKGKSSSGNISNKIIVFIIIIAAVFGANYLLEYINDKENSNAQFNDQINPDDTDIPPYSEEQKNDIKPVWDIIKEYDEKLQQQYVGLWDELKGIDLEELIFLSVSTPKELKNQRANIIQYERFITKHEKEFHSINEKFATKLANIESNDNFNNSKYEELISSVRMGNKNIEEFIRIHKSIAFAVKNMQDFLINRSGKYKIVEDNIIFPKSKDQDLFLQYFEKIGAARDQERSWADKQDDLNGIVDKKLWQLVDDIIRVEEN